MTCLYFNMLAVNINNFHTLTSSHSVFPNKSVQIIRHPKEAMEVVKVVFKEEMEVVVKEAMEVVKEAME